MRPPPAVPAGATATALGESRVEIRWQPSPDPSDGIVHEVRRDGRRVAESAEARVEEGGLSPAREYCYTVVARDARGGRSEPSQPVCATTPDLTPPAAPSIVAVATSDRAVELVWERPDDNVGSVRYEVLRGGSAVAVVEKPSSEEKGLSPAREYCYTVRAFDAAGNASRPSSPACATTPDLTPPSQPAAARALALDGARIEVAWRASTDDVGVVRYEVEPASGPTVKTSTLEWVERGLAPWTLRCYRVRAVDAAGNRSAPAGPLCARTLDVTPPTSPARPVAAPSSEVSVELSWEAATDDSPSGVVGYEVRRDGETIARTALTRASDAGRRPFTQYCYSVAALDGAGNRSAPAGPACARTPDVTPPTAPRGLVVYPASDSQLDAFWRPSTDNHGVAGYEVVRGGRTARAPAASAVESGLAPETEHCLRVRAYDAAGNRSGEAGPVCARTLAVGQPPPPRNVALQGAPRAVLEWDRVPAPSGLVYRVYEDGNRIGATRFPSYTVGPAAGAKRRCYTVTTLSEAGRESPPSGEACTSPLAAGAASN